MAALVGTAAIAGLTVWGPGQADAAALRFQRQVTLSESLVSFVDAKGMPWLSSAPWGDVCAAVAAGSNSTFHLSAMTGGASCGAPPPAGVASANVTFMLVSREMAFSAW